MYMFYTGAAMTGWSRGRDENDCLYDAMFDILGRVNRIHGDPPECFSFPFTCEHDTGKVVECKAVQSDLGWNVELV